MIYTPKNFDNLLGTEGFSDQLLRNHFTLYQAYVSNTNRLADTLGVLLKENKTREPEYAELKRRFAWEFNGMRLHEYYFGNMAKGGAAIDPDSALLRGLAEDFREHGNWAKDFKAVGVIRGVGWAVLCYDAEARRLFNIWVNEHDAGLLAGGIPLLIMDVFEHAFMIDYGVKRADYIEAFFKAIDWITVAKRFDDAANQGTPG